MKSIVIMARPMNGVSIRQDSKTKFFNANDLLGLYNARGKDSKRIQHYFDNEATKRYMDALLKEEIDNNRDSGELEVAIVSTKRGKNGGTWMHPYLFIDFAMWLSPEFKITVIKWVYDNLISLRLDAGDSFKAVNSALFNARPNSPPLYYSNEAKMINTLVFGKPDRGQRNTATEAQLATLKALQKADVKLIRRGVEFINRYEKLKEFKEYL